MSIRKTIRCPSCDSEVSLSNYKRHYKSKKCLDGGKQISNPSMMCKFCNEQFTTSSGRGVHEIQCRLNPDRKILNLGKPAWNKGIRTVSDNRNPEFIGKHGGYRPNAGRSKKFKVVDSFGKETVLQSSYELKCSEILNEMGIKWVRPKALKYDNKNYFADFYLPNNDVYLDPKNSYKAKLDQDKIQKVIEQNNVKVYIILEENLTKEYIASITQLVRVSS